MIALDLNLASRPIRNNILLWIGHGLLLAVILSATAWNLTTYIDRRADLDRLRVAKNSLESTLADLNRRESAARRGIQAHDLEELRVQAGKASDVIKRKALSWTRLFNLMEEILPYDVRMISIRPVFSFSRSQQQDLSELPAGSVPVSVEGSAKDLNAMLEFQRALIFDERFDRVEPHRFQRTTGPEVLFDMRFLYFPGAEPEPEPEPELLEAAAAPTTEDPEVTVDVAPEQASDPPDGSPAETADEAIHADTGAPAPVPPSETTPSTAPDRETETASGESTGGGGTGVAP